MGKRTVSIHVVAALIGGSFAIGAAPAEASSSVESCFFSAINSARSSRGRTRLSRASDLTSVARRHSARMAADGRIYHRSNLSSGVSGNWRKIGENVGRGPSCSSIHRGFMSSSSHRANIIDADFTQAGVGVAIDDDTIYVTEVFVQRGSAASRVVRSRPPAVVKRYRARPRPPAPRPKKRVPPVPPPVPLKAPPRTAGILLILIGLDSQEVDPVTGAAMGI